VLIQKVPRRGSKVVGCSNGRKNSEEISDSILAMEHSFRSDGIGKSEMIYFHIYSKVDGFQSIIIGVSGG
jgi:hypothetical protein